MAPVLVLSIATRRIFAISLLPSPRVTVNNSGEAIVHDQKKAGI
jgi:hypothetical protein